MGDVHYNGCHSKSKVRKLGFLWGSHYNKKWTYIIDHGGKMVPNNYASNKV